MKHRLFIVIIMTACLTPSFAMGELAPDNADFDAPIYEGARFQRYTETGNGVVVASFCSNAPQNSILKYYRSVYKNALEIQIASSGGPINKILLDVSSPSAWRNAKKFIEIYEDKKVIDCSSIIRITVVERQTDAGKPLVTGEAKEASDLQESKKVSQGKKSVGIGLYINTLNFSAGPTVILWPSNKFAIQGSYGVGTFTSYEIRGLYKFNLSSDFKPYLGAGYIHTEKQATVIGVDTMISGDSFNVFGGIEALLYKNLYLYADVGTTTMKLEKDVKSSTQSAIAEVDYAPVTVGVGVVLYLW